MRKLTLLLFLLVSVIAEGRKIPESEAAAIASQFFNSIPALQTKTGVRLVHKRGATKENTAPYYIYNADDNKKFVIISGDDRAKKILAYSDKGSFNYDMLPPQLSALLDEYKAQLNLLSDNNKTDISWSQDIAPHDAEGGVLLETANWGQGYPYNALCPIIDNTQAPVGCVATAMAIVMKYHNWPENGRNKWIFRSKGISIDFSQSHYDFNSYLNQYDSNAELTPDVRNLAQLFHDAGIALCTGYSQNESGANPVIMGHILMRFFRYSPECHNLIRKDYNDLQWKTFINDNLDKGLPIVYSGSNNSNGHTFVIDGYKNDLYHINWGWDGRLNGYFALEALNPSGLDDMSYDYGHSMIVNIKPDYTSQDFSEVWLDSGSDRGEDWFPEWEQQHTRGMGMGVDCSEIIPGKPFSLVTEVIHAPTSFGGEIAVALMKGNGQIIEILRSVSIDANDENPILGSIPYLYAFRAHKWKDLVYNGSISSDMYIQLVSRRNDEQEWKIINGTEQTPSHLPVCDNTPTVLKETVTYHGVDPDFSDLVKYESELVRVGQIPAISFKCSFGIAHLFYDDVYYGTHDDFHFKAAAHDAWIIDKPTRKVDIYYTPQNKLPHKSINVTEAGTLSKYFDDEDLMNLYNLKISGKISNEDIVSLYKLNSLGELDLSDASIEDNVLSEALPELRVLNLPKTLKRVSFGLDYYKQHTSSIINIPESVTDCGHLYARDFIVFNSSTPPNADYESIKDDVEYFKREVPAILIVPKGCKEAYQRHPHWKHFVDILEMDEEDYFDASFKVDENIMYCTITNKLASLTENYISNNVGTMILPDKYLPDGIDEFPYRYIKLPLNIDGRQFSFIKSMCPYAAGGYFNGRNFHFIPSEGFLTGYCFQSSMDDGWTCTLDYIISPLLQPNFSGIFAKALVPAHSAIGENRNTKDYYGNIIWERYEMFGLNCDKISNSVSIAPTLEGINIEKVLINGKETHPIASRYAVDFSQDVEIAVSYNFKNNQTMTTVYHSDFIANLPHNPNNVTGMTNLPNPVDSLISVYNLSGHLLYQGRKDNLPQLRKGIYIMKCGTNTRKIYIE